MDFEAVGKKEEDANIGIGRMERKGISQFKNLQRKNQEMA
jgi:hypothetical protein